MKSQIKSHQVVFVNIEPFGVTLSLSQETLALTS